MNNNNGLFLTYPLRTSDPFLDAIVSGLDYVISGSWAVRLAQSRLKGISPTVEPSDKDIFFCNHRHFSEASRRAERLPYGMRRVEPTGLFTRRVWLTGNDLPYNLISPVVMGSGNTNPLAIVQTFDLNVCQIAVTEHYIGFTPAAAAALWGNELSLTGAIIPAQKVNNTIKRVGKYSRWGFLPTANLVQWLTEKVGGANLATDPDRQYYDEVETMDNDAPVLDDAGDPMFAAANYARLPEAPDSRVKLPGKPDRSPVNVSEWPCLERQF